MIEIQLHGLDGVLQTLQSLPAEVVSKKGGPVKSALRKGALVILKAAKANLQAAVSNATSSGQRLSTGLLLKNVIASRGKAPTTGKGERYLVRVKKRVYQRKSKEPVKTIQTAQLLEYGSSKQPAESWLRPAFLANAREAIETIERELLIGIDKIVRKLARQNRGR